MQEILQYCPFVYFFFQVSNGLGFHCIHFWYNCHEARYICIELHLLLNSAVPHGPRTLSVDGTNFFAVKQDSWDLKAEWRAEQPFSLSAFTFSVLCFLPLGHRDWIRNLLRKHWKFFSFQLAKILTIFLPEKKEKSFLRIVVKG